VIPRHVSAVQHLDLPPGPLIGIEARNHVGRLRVEVVCRRFLRLAHAPAGLLVERRREYEPGSSLRRRLRLLYHPGIRRFLSTTCLRARHVDERHRGRRIDEGLQREHRVQFRLQISDDAGSAAGEDDGGIEDLRVQVDGASPHDGTAGDSEGDRSPGRGTRSVREQSSHFQQVVHDFPDVVGALVLIAARAADRVPAIGEPLALRFVPFDKVQVHDQSAVPLCRPDRAVRHLSGLADAKRPIHRERLGALRTNHAGHEGRENPEQSTNEQQRASSHEQPLVI
jgi:hypothetical protein